MALMILSCAGISKKNRSSKIKNESKINVNTQHWNKTNDSLNLYVHIALPLNRFVFKKQSDHFSSEIIFTLVISDAEKNTQIHRESWRENISEPYYENTRDPDNYLKSERNIALLPGAYKLFLNIQDEDSRKNWKINKKITLERVNYISPSLLFMKEGEGQMKQINFLIQKQDTIWLRTQVNFPQNDSLDGPVIEEITPVEWNKDIEYFVIHNETTIDSGKVIIKDVGIQNIYYLPIPITQHKSGIYKIELRYLEETQTTSFHYGFKTKNYWTDDIDEMIGVMGIKIGLDGFLSHSEYKKLKEMNESEQWTYIHAYWEKKDPSSETKENELLDALNERVKFANKNFSILMHGWRSDRGRIYIIYGEPHLVDESYQDNMGYNYLKWVYPNGKEFLFIDRTMSGDYTLHQERF